jgi:hypothetical protein
MFRSLESGKEKERNPFDKEDFLKNDIWERTDVLGKMLEARETKDPYENFFPDGPNRIALEGEVYYNPVNKKIYLGNKNGSWSIVNGLKEVKTSLTGTAFVVNSTLTGVGTVLGNVKGGAKELANIRNFEAMNFHPQESYEFNKLITEIETNKVLKYFKKDKVSSVINDGKIYIKGGAESVSILKSVATVAKTLGISAGLFGMVLSTEEYLNNKIPIEILALDGAMTILSFTGGGAFIAGVYFILIRTDTKEKHFDRKLENTYESAKVKIDNTRIDRQELKFITK